MFGPGLPFIKMSWSSFVIAASIFIASGSSAGSYKPLVLTFVALTSGCGTRS